MIGQQEAIRGEQEAGAGTFGAAAARANVDNGRAERIGDANDDAREGVERFAVVGRWRWLRLGGRVEAVADEVLPEPGHGGSLSRGCPLMFVFSPFMSSGLVTALAASID